MLREINARGKPRNAFEVGTSAFNLFLIRVANSKRQPLIAGNNKSLTCRFKRERTDNPSGHEFTENRRLFCDQFNLIFARLRRFRNIKDSERTIEFPSVNLFPVAIDGKHVRAFDNKP